MKKILSTAIGIASGTALYELVAHGVEGADWYRPIFVGVVAAVLLTVFSNIKNVKSS
jgi:hypothetical protein